MVKKNAKQTKAQEAEDARALNVKNTLEALLSQNVIGANQVKTNPFEYGQLGTNSADGIYSDFTASGEFNAKRMQTLAQRTAQMNKAGVYGEPSMPSNADVSLDMITQVRQVYAIANVGELEEHARALGAELGFEVPEELKGYTQMGLLQGAINKEGKFDQDLLSVEEQTALEIHQTLTDAYERACAVNTAIPGYFTEFNANAGQILEAYEASKVSKKK